MSINEQMDRHNAMCKQLSFTNIMHDKRVFRGSNFSKNISKAKVLPTARETVTRRQKIARKNSTEQEIIKKSAAVRRAEREAILQELAKEIAMYKEKKSTQLNRKPQKIYNPRPLLQTGTQKLYEHPQSQTISVQTEEDNSLAKAVSELPNETDASTKIHKELLFDFDTEVTPIIEFMIHDVLRQVTNEMLYKDKLAAIAQHRRTLYLERTTADIEKLRLAKKEKMTRKIISNHTRLFENGEKNEKARISKLPPSHAIDFVPIVLLNVNQNEAAQADGLELASWLTKELQEEKTKNIKIEDLLNDKYGKGTSHEHNP